MVEDDWLRAWTELVLRLDRLLAARPRGWFVDYHGPAQLRERVAAEALRPAGRLVDDADELAAALRSEAPPFDEQRRSYLAAQVRALRALAAREERATPMPELLVETLGIDAPMVPDEVFEQAHDELDRALPRRPGSLRERLDAWRGAHSLPQDRLDELPALVAPAVAECRARTSARLVPLPEGERVGCEVVPDVAWVGVADHHGGLESTILLGGGRPFNLADLLYVVAHEGHPGHLAEVVLKEIHLAGRGRTAQLVQFAPAPQYVLSEGLGLHAEALAFPGDEAQAWLTEHVLAPRGIRPDGSDFAAVHRARSALFGVQHNAVLLLDEGRSEAEVGRYAARWGLGMVAGGEPGAMRGNPYLAAYYAGWRLLDAQPDLPALARRILTEQLLPADLAGGGA